jgi:hypothetical protein
VNINCSSLSPDQIKLIEDVRDMLTKLLSKQTDKDAVQARLNDIYKLVSKPASVTQGSCSNILINPPVGTPISQSIHCGDVPMKMSDAGLAEFEKSLEATPVYEGLVVLLTTYSQDAFELSQQLCAPWLELLWQGRTTPHGATPTYVPPFACPETSGPSVRDGQLGHLYVWGASIPGVACLMPSGLRFGDSHLSGCGAGLVLGANPVQPYGEDLEGGSFTGLTCYSNDWGNPRGVAFQAAIAAAGLSCKYVPHEFQLIGMSFFASNPASGMGKTYVEKITVVIGTTEEY